MWKLYVVLQTQRALRSLREVSVSDGLLQLLWLGKYVNISHISFNVIEIFSLLQASHTVRSCSMLYYARNPSKRSRDDVAFWDYVNPQYLNDCLDNYSHVVLSTTVFDAAADEADEDDADADFGADGDRDDDGEDHLDDDDDDDDGDDGDDDDDDDVDDDDDDDGDDGDDDDDDDDNDDDWDDDDV